MDGGGGNGCGDGERREKQGAIGRARSPPPPLLACVAAAAPGAPPTGGPPARGLRRLTGLCLEWVTSEEQGGQAEGRGRARERTGEERGPTTAARSHRRHGPPSPTNPPFLSHPLLSPTPTPLPPPTTTAQVLAAASKALSLSNPATGSTISAPDAASAAFGSVTSFAQRSVEAAGSAADQEMPDSFKAAAAQSGAWAATETAKAHAAAAEQMAANAAADAKAAAAP